MINVLIVEDQRMIRGILEGFVNRESDFNLAASVSAASQAPRICDSKPVDLIFMDVQTEHRENGLNAVKAIKQKHPNIKIIVITSLIDVDVLKKARQNGADSLWYKDVDNDSLNDIIKRTLNGEHIFPDAPPTVEIGTAKSTEFTKTELIVLRYLVKGFSYAKIAKEMGIEVTTVKYHITNMLHKTGFENKLQLALAVSNEKMIAELVDIMITPIHLHFVGVFFLENCTFVWGNLEEIII